MKLGMGCAIEVPIYDFGLVRALHHVRMNIATSAHDFIVQTGSSKHGKVLVDPKGRRAWISPNDEPDGRSKWGWKRDESWELGTCIWAQHGV